MNVPSGKTLVVVATYNEAANIALLVRGLRGLKPHSEILIVDDNSPDGTASVADELIVGRVDLHLLRRRNRTGLRDALVAGFGWGLARDYEFIANMDADLSHGPQDLPPIQAAAQCADLVLGSRYVPGGRTPGRPMHRRVLSGLARRYARLLTGIPLADPATGLRSYRRRTLEALLDMGLTSTGFSVHFEMTHLCWGLGCSIREVPITFRGRVRGRSKMSRAIIREGIRVVWRLSRQGRGRRPSHLTSGTPVTHEPP